MKPPLCLLLVLSVMAACQSPVQTTTESAEPAQSMRYLPNDSSLSQYALPAWYQDAKLGIFIHWGLYSVPGVG